MKEKTNTTTEKSTAEVAVSSHLSHDLRNAVLIVSVVANLFVFTMWLILQMTAQYDASLAATLLGR